MRIAIVVGKLDPTRGGAESWSLQLGNWLLSRNYDVHFVCVKAAENLGIATERIHCVNKGYHCMQTADHFAAWLKTQSFHIVHDMGVGYQFDVLQPHFGSLIAHDRARDAASSTWRKLYRTAKSWLFGAPDYQLARRQYANSTGTYLAVSPKVARDIHELHHIDKSRIATICNGIDTDRFRPQPDSNLRDRTRADLGIDTTELTLLLVAHNYRLKGVPFVLETLQKLDDHHPPVRLIVAGGRRVQNWFNIRRHKVRFVGSVADVRPLLAACDAYLHPTYYDACSLSLLEAMASGVPSITTPMNGASCFIEHEMNGLILNRHCSHELGGLLVQLSNADFRQQLGVAARTTAAAWTMQHNFKAVEKLYEAILNARAGDICNRKAG